MDIDDKGRLVLDGLPPGATARVVLEDVRGAEGWTWTPIRRAAAVMVVLMIAAVALFATVGRHWSWSGFSGQDTLWSWMSLLATPIALAILPLELLTRGWSRRPWKIAGAVVAVLLAVVAVGGYVLHWSWTGLSGIFLWDWLHLLLFPVVLVFLPAWAAQGAVLGRRGRMLALLGLASFVVTVVLGYSLKWSWTGFAGNTFRDWLDLLIAPFLVPAACKVFHARQSARPTTEIVVGPIESSRTVDASMSGK